MISNKSVSSAYGIPDVTVRAADAELAQSSLVSALRLEPGSSVQGALASELHSQTSFYLLL